MALPTSKSQNARDTRQRAAIRQAFTRPGRLLGVKEVLETASHQVPGIGVATVYRNLRSMVEAGELVAVDLPGEPPRYALPDKVEPIIFLCQETGRAFTLPAGDFLQKLNLPEGFVPRESTIIVRGSAPDDDLS